MPFPILDQDTITANILRDIANQQPSADTGTDSDYGVRAAATGSAIEGLYDHQAWIAKQIFPDSADSDMLALHARVHGLSKKSATPADGTVQLNAQPGSPTAAAGQLLLLLDGTQIQTTADATVGADGTVVVAAQAVVAGSASNVVAGTAVTVANPPAGFQSKASIVTMVGGTDQETDESLLERLLDVIRNPPAGGNQYDFRRWALNVPGVTNAYVYPLRRGLGTVDIVITSSGGLPSPATVTAVQTYIDSMRPVTAKNALVLAPSIVLIDHIVNVDGLLPAVAQPLIQAALAGYFAGLAPGTNYVRSQSETLISEIAGITDRQIVTPTANIVAAVTASAVPWCQLGNLTVGTL